MRCLLYLTGLVWFLSGSALAQSDESFRQIDEHFFENTIYQTPDYRLQLGGQIFDPLTEIYRDQPQWLTTAEQSNGFFLVQYFQLPRKQDLSHLNGLGMRVVQALRPFSLVVWGSAKQISTLSLAPGIRWTGPFQPGFKVLPSLRTLQGDIQVTVLTNRNDSEGERFEDVVKSLGGSNFKSRGLDSRFTIWRGILPAEAFVALAQLPQVYTVQTQEAPRSRGELSAQLAAGNVDAMGQAVTGYQNWLTQLGLDGSGVLMACVDEGVRETHPDLTGRFTTCNGPGCAGTASSGHGTHVAGIMGGTGASGVTDPNGFLRAQGVAPGALMIEQNFLNIGLVPGGLLALVEESFANNAMLSNNSWGLSNSAAGYNASALELDIGVRDADPDTAGNQSFHYILAVANGNGGTSSIGVPDEAKNVFHVGAHQAQLTNTNQVSQYKNLATLSGHGPALDNRHLPLIVAPGCFVESAEPDTLYRMRCGTSMAAPHVAGGVALFIEYYRNLSTTLLGAPQDPSPALVKAAFLPVAEDLEGFLDADGNPMGHRFDSKQGWGRLDLPAILQPQQPVLYFDNPVTFNNTGEIWQRNLQAADSSQPVKLMLVWTDAPGHGLGGPTPALNNDLDLEVTYNGQTHLGNVFGASGWSVPGGLADSLNNTEGVLLGPTASGMFEIGVKATALNSDGVPGNAETMDQDFAIACYNCTQAPDFGFSATPNRIAVCAPDAANFDLSFQGFAGFSNAITLTAPNLPSGLTAQFSQNPVSPGNNSTLTFSGTENLARGLYELKVVATGNGLQREVIVDVFVEPAGVSAIDLTMPADAVVDLGLIPDFEWVTVAEANEYRFQLADDPSFTNPVIQEDLENNTFTPASALDADTTYYWRVAGLNACGVGTFSPVRSFKTRVIPPVLLVDDDDNTPDVRASYTQALDAIGIAYDVVDTQNSAAEPSDFNLYQAVIWFSGAVTDPLNPKAGPTLTAQTALASFLDQGGSLFISSQAYFNDSSIVNGSFNPFMQNYLGLANGIRDAGYDQVTGQMPVFNGIGPLGLSPAFSNESDSLNPSAMASAAFLSNQGNAGVLFETASFKTCWLGFALEGMAANHMAQTLEQWFEYLGFDLPCNHPSDILNKLPDWEASKNLAELIVCVNAVHAP